MKTVIPAVIPVLLVFVVLVFGVMLWDLHRIDQKIVANDIAIRKLLSAK
jgi:hypothetical protein